MTKPDEVVNFKWNSHKDKLAEEFPHLLADEKFVDVTIVCEGRSLRCHKMILSSCSSLLEKMLSSSQCKHPVVFLADIKFWEIQALVDYMYKGEVNVEVQRVSRLLEVAKKLEIKGLCDSIIKQEEVEIVDSAPEEILAVESLSEEESSPPKQLKRKRRKTTHRSPIQVETPNVDDEPPQINLVEIKVEGFLSDEQRLNDTIETDVKTETDYEVLEDCGGDPLADTTVRIHDPGSSTTRQDGVLHNKVNMALNSEESVTRKIKIRMPSQKVNKTKCHEQNLSEKALLLRRENTKERTRRYRAKLSEEKLERKREYNRLYRERKKSEGKCKTRADMSERENRMDRKRVLERVKLSTGEAEEVL